jgi:pyrroloquinoline quinone biosynthesis protein B
MLGDYLGPHPTQGERLRQPDGIFLTHAHMGHIAGLSQFGKAAMEVHRLPIFASVRLIDVFKHEDLYARQFEFDFIRLDNRKRLELSHELQITPISVPHRDEKKCGTFAFLVQGPEKSLLYLPDIDQWEQWRDAETTLASVDYALLDATFFSGDEIEGRSPVAHPLVTRTIELFSNLKTKLILTHLNHTNPLLDEDSPERESVLTAGVDIAHTGQVFQL